MRNKILIGVGIAIALFVVLLLIICGGSTSGGTVTKEQYETFISGVNAKVEGEEDRFIELSKLTDDTQFNGEIANKPYSSLEIKNSQGYKSLGYVFLIKAEKDCTLKFTLYKNEEVLKMSTLMFTEDTETDVNLLLETSVDVATTDNVYIKIEETGLSEGAEKTRFVFDSLLSFFDDEE